MRNKITVGSLVKTRSIVGTRLGDQIGTVTQVNSQRSSHYDLVVELQNEIDSTRNYSFDFNEVDLIIPYQTVDEILSEYDIH